MLSQKWIMKIDQDNTEVVSWEVNEKETSDGNSIKCGWQGTDSLLSKVEKKTMKKIQVEVNLRDYESMKKRYCDVNFYIKFFFFLLLLISLNLIFQLLFVLVCVFLCILILFLPAPTTTTVTLCLHTSKNSTHTHTQSWCLHYNLCDTIFYFIIFSVYNFLNLFSFNLFSLFVCLFILCCVRIYLRTRRTSLRVLLYTKSKYLS